MNSSDAGADDSSDASANDVPFDSFFFCPFRPLAGHLQPTRNLIQLRPPKLPSGLVNKRCWLGKPVACSAYTHLIAVEDLSFYFFRLYRLFPSEKSQSLPKFLFFRSHFGYRELVWSARSLARYIWPSIGKLWTHLIYAFCLTDVRSRPWTARASGI